MRSNTLIHQKYLQLYGDQAILRLENNSRSPFDVFVLDAAAMLGNCLNLTSRSVVQEFVDDVIMGKNGRPLAVVIKSKLTLGQTRAYRYAICGGGWKEDIAAPPNQAAVVSRKESSAVGWI
mmetsp:Transcript_23545/g.65510  ORF Transcript_23545/g.65510 Transcript_23545/m.65510 type:complete len:121 (-) Transcript_23545:167-529(-)